MTKIVGRNINVNGFRPPLFQPLIGTYYYLTHNRIKII